MLAFKIENGKVAEVAEFDGQCEPWLYRSCQEIQSWTAVERIADQATALGGRRYVATENSNRWPRFDVVEAPAIGDAVSYSFNGDTTPDGKVTKVSKSLRVVRTDTGSTYYRRGKTGTWLKTGGRALVRGHRTERNPHV